MSPEKRSEISRKGGQTAHAMGRAHEFNKEEAQVAGAKGGKKVAADRAHMSEIGRRGGLARHGKKPTTEAGTEGVKEEVSQ